jgi:tetratricopeptide (TPR) repeat protein
VYGLAGLAVVEQQKGRFQRAEALQERVLELFRDQEGPVHLNVARTISSLAMLAAAQGETRRAEALFRESMSIAEEAVGEGHPWIIEQLYNLGELYLDVGQPERAEPLLRQGLEAHSGTLAERHPVVGAFLHGHAEALMELGRWDEASEAFLEVLTLRERLLEGDDRPQTRTDLATTLLRLGQLRRRQHRDEEARAFWSRAVELLEPVTPTSLLFAALDTHASVLLELHRVEDAKPLLARMAAQGPLHPALERLCRRRGLEVPVALSRRSRSSSTQSP